MSEEQNKAMIQALNHEVYGLKKAEALLDHYAAGAVYRAVNNFGQTMTREGMVQLMKALYAAFPDASDTIDDIIAEGDMVAARHTFRGTHTGGIWGIAPSGKLVTAEGLYIARLAGGKFVEVWAAPSLGAATRRAAGMPNA